MRSVFRNALLKKVEARSVARPKTNANTIEQDNAHTIEQESEMFTRKNNRTLRLDR